MERLVFSKVTARLSNPWRSTSAQVDGSPLSGKQSHSFRTLSRSNINLLATGGAESRSEHGAEHTDTSLTTQPRTINVVLFGETGVGKSSVINLIARKEVAKVSSDVNGCTMQSTRYDIPFDGIHFSIFDTIGLEEPQMGVNGYLKAIEKAYELIMNLSAAGGIHLLLFCMRGGRITATTQSNYRLFCECLCGTKVPIALVFTGLEREVEMENWWERNETYIKHYGIKSNGHACITAVQDDTPGEDLKFTESQKKIRNLLRESALKNDPFLPESYTWFARLGRGMKSFIAKHRNPKKRDVMKVLTNRCKLDYDTARKIADMMEKGDTETKEGHQDVQEGATAGPPIDGHHTASRVADVEKGDTETKNRNQDVQESVVTRPLIDRHDTASKTADTTQKSDAETQNGHQDAQAGIVVRPPIDGHDTTSKIADMMEKGDSETKNGNQDAQAGVVARPPIGGMQGDGGGGKNAEDVTPPNQLGDVEAVPDESEVVNKSVGESRPLPNLHSCVEAEPPTDRMQREDKDRKKMAKKYGIEPNQHDDVEAVPDENEVASFSIAEHNTLPNPHGDIEPGPPTDGTERTDESEAGRKNPAKALSLLDGIPGGRRPRRIATGVDHSRHAVIPPQAIPKPVDQKWRPGPRQSSINNGSQP